MPESQVKTEPKKVPRAQPLRWTKGVVIQVHVKGNLFVLAQLLDEPYVPFFDHFAESRPFTLKKVNPAAHLFSCPVTRQFLKHSKAQVTGISGDPTRDTPRLRIASHPGTRKVIVWKGTQDERALFLLQAKSGGRLLERDPTASAAEGLGKVVRELRPSSFAATKGIELDVIWTYPLLNERLSLTHQLGGAVDPLKGLWFDKRPRSEFRTFIDILACHGSLKDWGYGATPAPTVAAKTRGRSGNLQRQYEKGPPGPSHAATSAARARSSSRMR
jgi:hypothetical protein